MALACGSTTSLTGQDGSVYLQPAATQYCLYDYSGFEVAATTIALPSTHDYRVGDPVVFTEEGTAKLDTALTAGNIYYVVAITSASISVSATNGGVALAMKGDGGTGTSDTPGAANHIQLDFAEFQAVCQVKDFSLDITREELDTTTLPCAGSGGSGGKYAQFKTTQSGYATGSGELNVLFTSDQTSIAQRLLSNVLLKNQSGAEVKLYVSHVTKDGTNLPDDDKSMFIQAPININSIKTSVNAQDVTTAMMSFSFSGQPSRLFGIDL